MGRSIKTRAHHLGLLGKIHGDQRATSIDQQALRLRGGKSRTRANQEESKYNYYTRNICLHAPMSSWTALNIASPTRASRAHPTVDLYSISMCTNVRVQNTILSDIKPIKTIEEMRKASFHGKLWPPSQSCRLNVSFRQRKSIQWHRWTRHFGD